VLKDKVNKTNKQTNRTMLIGPGDTNSKSTDPGPRNSRRIRRRNLQVVNEIHRSTSATKPEDVQLPPTPVKDDFNN
jgi:hypothetical protein